jgi:hypothetical protein
VLFAITITWTERITRPTGYSMELLGLALIGVDWLTGTEGFPTTRGRRKGLLDAGGC